MVFSLNFTAMSQAFMREGEDQWLPDVAPTIQALILFLTKENNGIRVYEKRQTKTPAGRLVHEMSNGLTYGKDSSGKWEVVT